MLKKDDSIAKAINLGLGKDKDITSFNKSELQTLIESKKETKKEAKTEIRKQNPPKHKFYRG